MKQSMTLLSLAILAALLAACGGETEDQATTPAAARTTAAEDATPEPSESESVSEDPVEPKEPRSDPQAVKELKGTYKASLTPKDVKKAGGIDMSIEGKYTIEIKGNGYIALHNPTFETGPFPKPIQPALYTADAKTFTTKVYSGFPECSTLDAGTYGWELKGGSLSFVLKKDECGLRRAIFLTRPWAKS